MTGLETLDLSTNRLAKLTLPKGLDNLKELDLKGNPLTSLTFSEISPNIKGLLISANHNGPRERESLEALLAYIS